MASEPLSTMQLFIGCEWGYSLRDVLIQRVERGLGHTMPPPGCAFICNHVFFSDGVTVVEAVWPRVRRIELAKKDATRYRLYRVPCRPEQASSIWMRANSEVGRWYDAPALLLSVWYMETGQQSRWYNSEHASVDCVEMVVGRMRSSYRSLAIPQPYDWTPSLLESRITAMFERVH